jgi:hypothetical protein
LSSSSQSDIGRLGKFMPSDEILRGEVAATYDPADPAKRSAFLFRGLAIGDFAVTALTYETAIARDLEHVFDT